MSTEIRRAVREQYGEIARAGSSGPGCCAPSCCGPSTEVVAGTASAALGYSEAELAAVPEGADLGLGCGNPQAIASLSEGEVVLDLGSGGGLDCFLAARQVGDTGQVIGVDMTPDMIELARQNAQRAGLAQVEFRLGEIEHLPVADASVDVILSNCVVNLSPDKPAVFREAFRVLRPGGRLAISDVVATGPLPEAILTDISKHVGCMAGAAQISEVEAMLAEAGFVDIKVAPKPGSLDFIKDWAPGTGIESLVTSATIEAIRP